MQLAQTKTDTHLKYRPDIDGLRALAVLSVIGFHAFPNFIPGGFVGVDIFFVISGFLISTIILDGLERGNFSFLDFYSRRVRRIFPALLSVLVGCTIFGWFALIPEENALLGKHVAAAAVFTSNFLLWSESGYFDVNSEMKPLLHLWSLGIEEQFYALAPAVFLFVYRKRISFRIALTALIILSFCINLSILNTFPVANFYSPLSRMFELLIGSLLAVQMRHTNHSNDIKHSFCVATWQHLLVSC